MRVPTSAAAGQSQPPGVMARVCHEIRNPLNAVLGYAQLLAADRDVSLSQRQRQQVRAIDEAAQHILQLVNDALHAAARGGASHRGPHGVVALDKVVHDVMRWMEPIATQAGVALVRSCESARVRGDAQQLHEVVINLVSNAVKYNRPTGEVHVSVGAGDRPDTVCLAVRDTGPGIDPEGLSRLFRPYERLGAESRGIEGTGLGLCITRQLVERMGGSMHVSSRVGVGTVFVVQLRAA